MAVPDVVSDATVNKLGKSFHTRHAESYGFSNENEETQIVNLRVIGIGSVDRPVLRHLDKATDSSDRAKKGKREVYFSDSGLINVDLYDRNKLLAGDSFKGPAIVEQMDTTVVIPSDAYVEVEEYGNLIISLQNV